MRFPWPLRYTIPGIILLLGLFLSVMSFFYERQIANDQLETLINRHVQFIGNQISGISGYFLEHRDLAGLQRQVSALGADPILRVAFVCDDQLKVLVSSRFEFSGVPLQSTPLSYAQRQIAKSKGSATVLSEDRRSLLGIFPFALSPDRGELISTRTAYLLLEYDLAHPKAQIVKGFINRSLFSSFVLGAACLLAWSFFHRVLNHRIATLVNATEKLASGEVTDCLVLKGSDELAKLARAFALMAERVSSSTTNLRDANQRMIQEITERKYIEEALRNSERRFRSIWENSLEPMRLTDSKGTVLTVNDAYCKLVEREMHELLQQPFVIAYDSLNSAERLHEYEEGFRTRNLERYQHKKVKLPSGRDLELEISYSFIDMEHDRPLLLAIFRDVTEKKKQEEQRLALERKLLDSQKLESLGVLAGGIAHDFNNLLAAILGNTNLAQMQLGPSAPAANYLRNVEKTSLRAADLCKQMLAYSGKGRFTVHFMNANEVVRETLELLEVSITKKASLRVELRPEIPNVYGDPAQLRQVIMNLVINASEALADKSGVIRIRTGVVQADAAYFEKAYMASEMEPGRYVFVEVSDTGCGMSSETQSRIFDPFFTTKFTGRGLGLAAVLGIVRGHRGALKLQSELGQGSTFTFLLPAASLVPKPSPSATTNIVANWKGEGTILIVDDDPAVRAVTARMVESCGFDVLQAVDGRHGVEVFSNNQHDIRAVVLDMTMPNLDGREALEELRRLDPDVKVIMVSGFSENVGDDSFNGKAPDSFLQKPFRSEELNGKLRHLLSAATQSPRALHVRCP